MDKQHFLGRLLPPRPTFAQDMNDAELALMRAHAAYAREHFDSGHLLIYGPVMAAAGSFGLAVLEVSDEAEARQFFENDPTVRAGLNSFEISPMRVAAARATEV